MPRYVHSPSISAIVGLGLLLLAIFAVWLAVANAIFQAKFGYDEPATLAEFARRLLATPQGHNVIIVGNAVGFLFAVLAFGLSVASFPLLLDRHVGVSVAIITSVRTHLAQSRRDDPVGIFVAACWSSARCHSSSALPWSCPCSGTRPGTSTARCSSRKPDRAPEYNPKPKGQRCGADFPVALFMPTIACRTTQ